MAAARRFRVPLSEDPDHWRAQADGFEVQARELRRQADELEDRADRWRRFADRKEKVLRDRGG